MSPPSDPEFLVKIVDGVTIVTFTNPKVGLGVREPLYALVENEGHKRIVLNFREVRVLSSAPIGVLLNFRKMAKAVGISVKFCCLDSDIVEIFRITSVLPLFDIRDTEEEAVASF
jgi:anti-sigma B factor antagonist